MSSIAIDFLSAIFSPHFLLVFHAASLPQYFVSISITPSFNIFFMVSPSLFLLTSGSCFNTFSRFNGYIPEASKPAFKLSTFRVFCIFVKNAGKWLFGIEPLIRDSLMFVCKIFFHSTFKGLKTAITSGCSRCVAFGIKHVKRILFSKL